jgi:glycosyltransferase involved in cell wall biosynthesis
MPTVSIIIPAKNRSAELAEALASLRAQTCDDWEAVVVDDASTQDLAAVVARQGEARIRYVKLPPGRTGAPAGRNHGFKVTTGQFVLFFDSDDHLAPDAVEQRLRFLQARPELDFAVWGCRQFRHTPGDLPLLWNQLIKPGVDDLDRYICRDTPSTGSADGMKRPSPARIGNFRSVPCSFDRGTKKQPRSTITGVSRRPIGPASENQQELIKVIPAPGRAPFCEFATA